MGELPTFQDEARIAKRPFGGGAGIADGALMLTRKKGELIASAPMAEVHAVLRGGTGTSVYVWLGGERYTLENWRGKGPTAADRRSPSAGAVAALAADVAVGTRFSKVSKLRGGAKAFVAEVEAAGGHIGEP
jgi:hypothetical protein